MEMSDGPEDLLAGFRRRITVPVQWGDMDALGHVNNVVYFRWIESSRIDILDHLGLFKSAAETGIGPILAKVSCDFRKQLHFPDTVHIGCRVEQLGRSSMQLSHIVVSSQQQVVAAEGSATLVVYDYRAGKSVPIEGELRQQIESLMAK
jgi:acyl-CoA thioester hydrolase